MDQHNFKGGLLKRDFWRNIRTEKQWSYGLHSFCNNLNISQTKVLYMAYSYKWINYSSSKKWGVWLNKHYSTYHA